MKNFVIKSKRDFPSVEILASDKAFEKASKELPRPYVIEIIRSSIEKFKTQLGGKHKEIDSRTLIDGIIRAINSALLKKVGKVINGTGILVHTNLGRAPLSEALFDTIKKQITGYGNLEFSITTGKRGKRGELAEKYLALISGAEAGAIVNNNAAALYLILNTFANRRKILISRGELVQIGGGFRIPDLIKRSGARLVEVGTTNITSVEDYQNALDENPAMILKVHRSSFALSGFTAEADIKDLVKLGHAYDIPVVNDLGSGVLIDTTDFVGSKEPSVQASVREGAFITCFSGDKLLGGMQAGLIVGNQERIIKLKKNPIYRALRVDKTIFSAMEELLGYYLNGTWKENIKLWQLASRSEKDLLRLGKKILGKIKSSGKISLEKSTGEMGGGSLPEVLIPSAALVFTGQLPPQKIATQFRLASPSIIGRISENRFLIDLKAVDNDDVEPIIDVINKLIDTV